MKFATDLRPHAQSMNCNSFDFRSSSKQINPSTCQLATERRFTTFEKVFLCLACIFD